MLVETEKISGSLLQLSRESFAYSGACEGDVVEAFQAYVEAFIEPSVAEHEVNQ